MTDFLCHAAIMGNAVWLFLAVPQWYLATIGSPFQAGVLTAVPAFGVLCLVVGVVLGFIAKKPGLLLFLVPLAASQSLLVAAGILRGKMPHPTIVLIPFLILQLAISVYVVFRVRGGRTAAIALAAFCLSYALFATFVAGMSFTDEWL